MSRAASPFVLLEFSDGDETQAARLYCDAVEIVTTHDPATIASCLDRLRAASAKGLHVAGYMAFEAGYALEPRWASDARSETPLLWFGLFERYQSLSASELAAWLPDPAGAWCGAPVPLIDPADYLDSFNIIRQFIADGDIYQANLTFQAQIPIHGPPAALYARLRQSARSDWGGIIHDGAQWLLSLSPELFFTLEKGRLTARPMKGTALRHADFQTDNRAAARLQNDPKQRAENLMIVDLLRNDLSRVAEAGSVAVEQLFTIETYPTVHQMTSTIKADLARGVHAIDVLQTLFPCGSITGAPKIRAMEILRDLEAGPRGAYTGTIGSIGPNGTASFNVAIRTLAIPAEGHYAGMGLGSAIVADSVGEDEWRECLAKGQFVARASMPFDLIETMRFDANEGLLNLDLHMARMKASAEALGFLFNRHSCRNELQAATFRLQETVRVRLLLARSGAMAIEVGAMPEAPAGVVNVAICPLPVSTADFRLCHKTSDRAFYDDARRAANCFEVIFVDPDGLITEGSFTNVFVPRDGKLITPRAGHLLPGILRARHLADGFAIEGNVTPDDLKGGFFIGNALRGLLPATLTAA